MITYKLFRLKHGKLYPLYVNASKPTPLGVWLDAEAGERTSDGKVKSRLGKLTYRPGWHSGDMPVALHIGEKRKPSDAKPSYRPSEQVWCECEVKTDNDYTKEAGRYGLKSIPKNGGYWFKTNSNMIGRWYISGEIKVNKILTDKEVNAINKRDGVFDLPRRKIS